MKPSADDGRQALEVSQIATVETAPLGLDQTPRDRAAEMTHSFHSGASQSPAGVAPERIGRYRVLRLLGAGSFGRVWLASDDELQREVAIKVLFPSRDAPDLEARLAEARAMAALDHPQILPVYDVGQTEDGSVYVVAKFIAGQTLQQHIQQAPAGRVSLAETVSIVAGLAGALHHAHDFTFWLAI